MPQAASWAGTPSIKGSTESVRMALLTFSLVGLQYVLLTSRMRLIAHKPCRFTWGIEMTCETSETYHCIRHDSAETIDRLHSLSPPTRSDQE